ncbi:hypothetical protein TNIN_53021 [Trichonephila inaurata madagascariensis]|uniref:Uncharacterized protein n=1 Tax=Trichonephila inaurata madagascariensis TaxID=2747483 RepID=A0A8X6X7H2_9ARAC|nr:hypothetical protein TNIN_53021 [Trichonephila inaurata madagascariensis]
MANWHECPAFPKIKAKKGDPSQNRNTRNPLPPAKPVDSNLTYANVTKPSQQREPRDRSKSVISVPEAPKPHTTKTTPPPPPSENNNHTQDDNFTFMDAVKEIKTLFTKNSHTSLRLGSLLMPPKSMKR